MACEFGIDREARVVRVTPKPSPLRARLEKAEAEVAELRGESDEAPSIIARLESELSKVRASCTFEYHHGLRGEISSLRQQLAAEKARAQR